MAVLARNGIARAKMAALAAVQMLGALVKGAGRYLEEVVVPVVQEGRILVVAKMFEELQVEWQV